MKTEVADISSSSDDDDAVAVMVKSDVKADDREIVRCMTDPALITAAESITNSFLTAAPEPVAKSSLKRTRVKQRRCGCALGETCHICNKCPEKHCTCGDRKRHRSLCLESRACTCLLLDPADRCALCHGCQRKVGYSHCRCTQHEKQRLQRSRAVTDDKAPKEGEKSDSDGVQCRCFAMSADVIPPAANTSVNERSLWIRRLRRAIGIPSVESLYHRTIGASVTDDKDAEEEEERDPTKNGEAIASSEEGLQSVLHHPLTRRLMSIDTYTPSYQQLLLGDSVSLLESIEPKDGVVRSHPLSKSLVDYLVHTSSVKAATVSEMVGTFDDSAAVAAAIVVEEYMSQILGDLLAEKRPVFSLTKASVQAFASHMLKGFNWALLYQQHAGGVVGSKWRELTSAIYGELVAVERLEDELVPTAKQAEIWDWIRETVAHHRDFLQSDTERRPAAKEYAGNNQEKQHKASEKDVLESFRRAASDVPTPHVRVGVRRNEALGLPVYNFTLKSKLAGDHLIRVSADNLENQQKALSKVDDVKKALAEQHKRIWNNMVEDMPAMLQRQLASELELPTGREIVKLPDKVLKYFDMKDEKWRKKREMMLEKKRLYDLEQKAKLQALVEDPKVTAEMQAEKERKHAATLQRREARKAATLQRKAEEKRITAEKRALKEQMRTQKARKWKTVEELESINDPDVDALYQQLRIQVRQTAGGPSSRAPPGEEPKPPSFIKPRARAKKKPATKKPKPEATKKPAARARSVRPKAPVDPTAPRRPSGRPRKVAPTEDTNTTD